MKPEKSMDRRAFLKAAGGAAVGMAALAGPAASAGRPEAGGPTGRLIERKLGRTGLKVPIVAMGVMNADNPELVRRAYELGIRHFDTANVYQRGRNEEMVGRVLVQELNARDEVVIATKINIRPPQRSLPAAEIRKMYQAMMEESLRRLRTDHVDILYAHDVSDVEWAKNPAQLDYLLELKAAKKTRFIGLSTHQNMDAVLKAAVELKVYDVVLTTLNYSLYDYTEYLATLEKAAAQGVGLIAMKTQCQQAWYREELPAEAKRFYEGPILHSALLKWVLRHDFITCAVPGFTTFEQLNMDMPAAGGLEYTEEERRFLEDRLVKERMSAVCRLCGGCIPSCPRHADVPNLLRAHMYAAGYGNLYQARETLDAVGGGRAARDCVDCAACTARCVRGVDIARRIEELKALMA